ncbi:oligosaccharyltransferase complex subunit epsilon [Naganishia albida]|nr:oligosaccharyltransferase complex subunit epsilon [Naganishia albida]
MAGTKASVKPTENSASALQSSISTLVHNYRATTLTRTKLIDCFLLVLVVSGVLQFAYRILVTSYPFNAFLGSFGGTVGQFVLLAGLRAQTAPDTIGDFKGTSQERAFAEFCAASIVLHLFMYNFLG